MKDLHGRRRCESSNGLLSSVNKIKEKDLRGRGRGQSSKGLHSSVCTNRVPATDPKVLYQRCYSRPFPILKTVLGSAIEAPPRCVPPGIADPVSKAVYMLARLLLWAFNPSQSDHTCHLLQLTQHRSSQMLGYSRGRKLVLTSSALRRYLTSRANTSYSSLIPQKRYARVRRGKLHSHRNLQTDQPIPSQSSGDMPKYTRRQNKLERSSGYARSITTSYMFYLATLTAPLVPPSLLPSI